MLLRLFNCWYNKLCRQRLNSYSLVYIIYLLIKSLEWKGKQFLLAETEGRLGLHGQGNLEMIKPLFVISKFPFLIKNNSNIVCRFGFGWFKMLTRIKHCHSYQSFFSCLWTKIYHFRHGTNFYAGSVTTERHSR